MRTSFLRASLACSVVGLAASACGGGTSHPHTYSAICTVACADGSTPSVTVNNAFGSCYNFLPILTPHEYYCANTFVPQHPEQVCPNAEAAPVPDPCTCTDWVEHDC